MATFPIPKGRPTLSTWVTAIREAAARGTVPRELAEVTNADVVTVARIRDCGVCEGRIESSCAGDIYFGLCHRLVPDYANRLTS